MVMTISNPHNRRRNAMKSQQTPRLKQESCNEDQHSSDDDGLVVLYSRRQPSPTTASVTHHHSTKENSLNSPHYVTPTFKVDDPTMTVILHKMIANEKRMARTLGIKSASEFCFGTRGHNPQHTKINSISSIAQHHYRTFPLHSHPSSRSLSQGVKGFMEFPRSSHAPQQRSLSGIYGRIVKKCPVLDSHLSKIAEPIHTSNPSNSPTTTTSTTTTSPTTSTTHSSPRLSTTTSSTLPTNTASSPTTTPNTFTAAPSRTGQSSVDNNCTNQYQQTPTTRLSSSQRCSFDSKINMLFSSIDEDINEEQESSSFKQPYSKPVTSIIFEEIDTDSNPKKRKQDCDETAPTNPSLPPFSTNQPKFKKQKSIDEITAENMYESLLNQCRKNYIPQLESMNALASEVIESPNEQEEPSCEVVPILSRHQLDRVVGEKLCAIAGPMTPQDKSIIKFIESNPINDFLLELLENKKFNGF
ncbi:hypothetical protein C9374_004182 [Naegleria lovaniensis]|uniref:Uncharacterized protein n=1 Tax=Naegleria lovaniensis TaxID=51637 RepID=A0AA88KPB0_NAELO|nr:uncharacterized protein C9374_004182 [Naegleria lovaniensis]KAG2383511.1 hypothetical protein C9374_004182 [Naegleria lovaniensis]